MWAVSLFVTKGRVVFSLAGMAVVMVGCSGFSALPPVSPASLSSMNSPNSGSSGATVVPSSVAPSGLGLASSSVSAPAPAPAPAPGAGASGESSGDESDVVGWPYRFTPWARRSLLAPVLAQGLSSSLSKKDYDGDIERTPGKTLGTRIWYFTDTEQHVSDQGGFGGSMGATGCVSTHAARNPAAATIESNSKHSVSHEDYLWAYEHVKPDNEPMPQLSAERHQYFERQRVAFGLSVDEADAIFAYTARFYHVNQDLRSSQPSPASLVFATVINRGLEKLPNYRGTVYRNIWPFPGYKDRYRSGAIVSEVALTSTRLSLRDGPMMSEKEPIRFVISSLHGHDISAFSAHWENEAEIFFKTGTKFRVTDVKQVGNFNGYDGRTLYGLEFHMEELSE